MTTFLLIRHADNDLVGKALAGRAPGVHLNAAGRQQAQRLAQRLARETVHQVYSGPLERARETAEPLARLLGLEVRVADELGEVDFGEWTGQTLARLDPVPKWQQFNSFRSGTRVPGGELLLETQARMVVFMERLREQLPGSVLALVSHGDVVKAAVAYYLGVPLDLFQRIEIGTASLSAITVTDHGPLVHYVNRTENGA